MSEQTQPVPFESLAKMNEDGSMAKFLAAPMLVIIAVGLVIVLLRSIQSKRERASTESLLKE